MIQSGKFDSSKMNIKKIANTALQFIIKRLIEIFGVVVIVVGLLLFVALISYSPDDPNFIFPENTKIKNFLGFQGSYISDLFFQSVGLISYLISCSLIFTGINIFKSKDVFLIIENIFFTILYSTFGSLFLSFYYKDAYELYINGNGGFIGNYLSGNFLGNLINLNISLAYYFLIISTLALFLVSINFNLKKLLNFLKNVFYYFNKDKDRSYTDRSEIINEYIPQDEIKNKFKKIYLL